MVSRVAYFADNGKLQFPDNTEQQSAAVGGQAFPVGAVFLSVVATNPASLLGYGTWTQIAIGQMLVGYKSGDSDFGTVEQTGGAKTHTHAAHAATATSEASAGATQRGTTATTLTLKAHTHNTPILGHDTPTSLPPYFVVYAWKRTT